MSIIYNQLEQTFNLKTSKTSYCIGIHKSGVLLHLYYGKRTESENLTYMIQTETRENLTRNDSEGSFTYNTLPLEIGFFGNGDYRTPGIQIEDEKGARINEFKYKSHTIYRGKKRLLELPSAYDTCGDTIEIVLFDEVSKIELTLIYHLFEDTDVMTRSIRVKNCSSHRQRILKAMSLSMDMNDSDYVLSHLSGRWGCERQWVKRPLVQGMQSIDSRSGISSHIHSPSFMLSRKNTCESSGEVYGYSFIYSGNFQAEVEVSEYKTSRVHLGINPFEFSWLLEKDQVFNTPEVAFVYSNEGYNGMSHNYHNFVKNHILQFDHKESLRPVLINNWEATYFDFNEEKLLEIAEKACDVGIELFVLDDGWFGERDSDRTSLGDWYVNKNKLPSGIEGLSKKIRGMGMKFGLWFEPEMVSKYSKLYERHPEWAVHIPGRPLTEERNQHLLDFTKFEVREYIIESISKILSTDAIDYVKWDMNRKITESYLHGSNRENQTSFAHRYMLGVYEVMQTITSKFPHILFEGCTSGGGRFDMGMLNYMPQFWTSDNTDAHERLKIQYATSLFFPQVTMGAHVSEVPNHQVERVTDLKTRTETAFVANLGYELDLTKMNGEELIQVKEDVEKYKSLKMLLQYGTFSRIKNPFEGNAGAWQVVNEDRTQAALYYQRVLASANMKYEYVKFLNLNEQKTYSVNDGIELKGDVLMNVGIPVDLQNGDFKSSIIYLKSLV